ncbi:electron transport complex subunit RsxC [Reinekea marinisedimentorum]|uniref:Ion-translocating oxidoreductase complex subunit C n=1 Tax=Reinekea marinisedimentorum TaxID=230495 RepID=A0A4R3IA08_9GAMM|nr:electron transport complex subunit RsxC [Reinekea marinisedimentorum]TCS41974.1 electron transport complex protein RnfC [Reinekea marinisedimentorum]
MNQQANLITTGKVWSIPGGIHPAENKSQSNATPIETLPVPSELWLPLTMHIGAEALPIVKVGDTVCKGELIAQAQTGISASVHAPTSGRITAIKPHPFAHESGLDAMAICIESDGLDAWRKQTPWKDWQQHSAEEILERIHNGGITGLGGAGFPTDIKYRNKHAAVHTLLVNAAECEPYITADDVLIRYYAKEILMGAQISQMLCSAETIIIGIEDNKPEAAQAFREAAKELNLPVTLTVVPTKYPSGGEKQLIQLTTGLEVPAKRLPSDVGVLCQNVGTLRQIYRTVVHDEPLISRITTVTGKAVNKPGNYEVLIGTSIETLLNQAEAHLKKAERVIMGGPMMGFAIPDIAAPIVKATNCILAPTKKELPVPMFDNPCIRCGMCEQVCPVNLLPQQMLWASRNRQLDNAALHSLPDCIECGACSFVCPSNIPLVQYFRYAKGEIRQEEQDNRKAEQARIRFENRQARQEREKIEKEERRKARAEAAAKALAAKKEAQPEGAAPATDAEDPIKAALARAAAKKQEKQASAASKSIDELKADVEKAKTKQAKALERLAEAEKEGSEMVNALRKAAGKLEEKTKSAELALQQAQEQSN